MKSAAGGAPAGLISIPPGAEHSLPPER